MQLHIKLVLNAYPPLINTSDVIAFDTPIQIISQDECDRAYSTTNAIALTHF
ncbi:MAG: hypothetical protein V7K53_29040 [Nostoc sp.]|uniref:hypothetical protein n=1 Tax=Nostoc sp. TaxID=1180 RepID=UPI002FFABE14